VPVCADKEKLLLLQESPLLIDLTLLMRKPFSPA